jgi:hypothetical protein
MSESSRDDVLFMQLVATFQYAAMQQMGKIPNPATGKIERSLEQARMSIDILGSESEFLDKVVFELQMNYVDETRRGDPTEPPEAESPPEEK